MRDRSAGRCGRDDYDGLEARAGRSRRAIATSRRRAPRARAAATSRASRGQRVHRRATTRSSRGSTQFRLDADADLAAALQQELRGRHRRLRGAEGARRARSTSSTCCCGARPGARQRRRAPRLPARASRTSSSTSSRTPTRCRRRSCCCSPPTIPSEDDWRRGRARPRHALHRRRPEAVDLPLPPRRRRHLSRRLRAAASRPARPRVKLTTSFRSVPAIQACVNAAFAPVMTGDAVHAAGRLRPARAVPAGDRRGSRRSSRCRCREPYGVRNVSAIKIEQSLPDAVGAFVDWLVNESGWTVTRARAPDRPVPMQARHICILFRRFVSFGERHHAALRPRARGARRPPRARRRQDRSTIARRSRRCAPRSPRSSGRTTSCRCSRRCAARCSRSATRSCSSGSSASAVFHPFRIPQPIAASTPTRSAAASRADRRGAARAAAAAPPPQLPAGGRDDPGSARRDPRARRDRAAQRRRAGAGQRAARRRAGARVRGAAAGSRSAASSTSCATRPSDAQAAEAPILEEGSDGVRLMTVHKAKGLEFPVVILADITCKLARAEAGRWLDPERNVCALKIGGWAPIDLLLHDAEEAARDRAEAERLAYVAATRARDLLVVPAIGDGAVRRRLARSADAGDLSAGSRAPRSAARARRARLQVEGLRPAPSRRRSRVAQDRRARHLSCSSATRSRCGRPRTAAPRASHLEPPSTPSPGGIRARCASAPPRRSACAATI